ncbi:MAG: FAD-dependent oxidoreductase [Gammaproteobacteria bacterium]|nr:FAD-dependent oxidoreductase [Gammaproteobacteria bacterium]
MARVAIIGAGIAGLVTARELAARHDVVVFEKSRGVGGRMTTRYADNYVFDHGAQFFTARTPEFQLYLRPLVDAGIVASWNCRFAEYERDEQTGTRQWGSDLPHYVGVPGMNAIGKWLAKDLDVRLETRVGSLQKPAGGWQLIDDNGGDLGIFDWVILAAPAAQTTALLPADCRIRRLSEPAVMLGCYSLMLADPRPLALEWDAALVRDADISWISVDSSKPGRPDEGFCMLVHSTNEWADAYLDADDDWVMQHLLAETSVVLGVDARSAAHCTLHRWRYANMDLRNTPGFSIDEDQQLGACGDWFIRGRVEAAFTSATGLLKALPFS